MQDYTDIPQPAEKAVWEDAAERWYRQNVPSYVFDELGQLMDDEGPSIEDAPKYAASIDWNICHYCAGPCGYCPHKGSGEAYCECCDNTIFGITECTFCPIRNLKFLISQLPKESK